MGTMKGVKGVKGWLARMWRARFLILSIKICREEHVYHILQYISFRNEVLPDGTVKYRTGLFLVLFDGNWQVDIIKNIKIGPRLGIGWFCRISLGGRADQVDCGLRKLDKSTC